MVEPPIGVGETAATGDDVANRGVGMTMVGVPMFDKSRGDRGLEEEVMVARKKRRLVSRKIKFGQRFFFVLIGIMTAWTVVVALICC